MEVYEIPKKLFNIILSYLQIVLLILFVALVCCHCGGGSSSSGGSSGSPAGDPGDETDPIDYTCGPKTTFCGYKKSSPEINCYQGNTRLGSLIYDFCGYKCYWDYEDNDDYDWCTWQCKFKYSSGSENGYRYTLLRLCYSYSYCYDDQFPDICKSECDKLSTSRLEIKAIEDLEDDDLVPLDSVINNGSITSLENETYGLISKGLYNPDPNSLFVSYIIDDASHNSWGVGLSDISATIGSTTYIYDSGQLKFPHGCDSSSYTWPSQTFNGKSIFNTTNHIGYVSQACSDSSGKCSCADGCTKSLECDITKPAIVSIDPPEASILNLTDTIKISFSERMDPEVTLGGDLGIHSEYSWETDPRTSLEPSVLIISPKNGSWSRSLGSGIVNVSLEINAKDCSDMPGRLWVEDKTPGFQLQLPTNYVTGGNATWPSVKDAFYSVGTPAHVSYGDYYKAIFNYNGTEITIYVKDGAYNNMQLMEKEKFDEFMELAAGFIVAQNLPHITVSSTYYAPPPSTDHNITLSAIDVNYLGTTRMYNGATVVDRECQQYTDGIEKPEIYRRFFAAYDSFAGNNNDFKGPWTNEVNGVQWEWGSADPNDPNSVMRYDDFSHCHHIHIDF